MVTGNVLIADSVGAGKFRGSLGMCRSRRPREESSFVASVTCRSKVT